MFYDNDPIPFTDSLEISDSKVDLAPPLLSIGSWNENYIGISIIDTSWWPMATNLFHFHI